jgi:hypothetical protein
MKFFASSESHAMYRVGENFPVLSYSIHGANSLRIYRKSYGEIEIIRDEFWGSFERSTIK